MSRVIWKGTPLLAPVPAVLVGCGTVDKPNLITVGWTGIINTQPPRLSISIRPERYSYELIRSSGEFTVNLPSESLVRALDWCGVKSGRDVNKFEALNLTPEQGIKVSAPMLSESPLCMECKVFDSIDLGSHTLFLADILCVDIEDRLIDDTGKLQLERAHLINYMHGEYYTQGKRIGSFGCSVRKKKKGKRKGTGHSNGNKQ